MNHKKPPDVDDLPLFQRTSAYARGSDPITSEQAAASVRMSDLEDVVYHVIHSFGIAGAAGFEVALKLPLIGIQTISPRYAPLIRKGFVVRGSTKQAPSGRAQYIMIAKVFLEEARKP